jgi:hypothetical protein
MGNNAAKDTETYRNGYPGQEDDDRIDVNVRFYQNNIPSKPEGAFIDQIHAQWHGDYSLLERHHGYIQWLFPIREHGMNYQSQPLQMHEMAQIKADPACQARVIKSYRLMLDFYGFDLVDEATGAVRRAENYRGRFQNLCNSSHNWLRVTRILKSLGELGFEHFKLPWLLEITNQVFVTRELSKCQRSLVAYWAWTLRTPADQRALQTEIAKYFRDAENVEL